MRTMNRRTFVKRAAGIPAGLAAAGILPEFAGFAAVEESAGVTAAIPMPIQVVIDDVGWWNGHNGSQQQEPFRTGFSRNHVPEDYQAIVDLGRALNIRPQAATILCEWDRRNILRRLPTATWMGAEWDNSKWVGPWMEKAADIIRNNRDHYELTMHGVGHEYWTGGKFTRAEWAERNGTMRPLDQVEAHLDAYAELLDQNQLGPFPSAWVPCAFYHGFGPIGESRISAAEVVKKRGIAYINTPFNIMGNKEGVQYGLFGFDAGVITVDRGQDALGWTSTGVAPTRAVRGPTCGMHWPNVLHPDPQRNSETVDGWVRFLRPFNDRVETMLAQDSLFFRNQLVHNVCTALTMEQRTVRLDFTRVDGMPGTLGRKELTLRFKSPAPMQLHSRTINVASQSADKKDGFILTTVRLERIPGRPQAELTFA
jgi:hypothetical protein